MQDIQEMEEASFVHETEFAMCFQEAQMARNGIDCGESMKIEDALASGLFVVVHEAPYFCKTTDACAGTVRYFAGAFCSREEAQAVADRGEQDAECHSFVLPALQEQAPILAVEANNDDDDVPF